MFSMHIMFLRLLLKVTGSLKQFEHVNKFSIMLIQYAKDQIIGTK